MIKTLQNTLKQDKERFTVPKSVQDIIPIRRIWPDGVFQFGSKYSKTLRFSDINYAIASKEDKTAMFLSYSELLNALDTGSTTKITINNKRLDRRNFEQEILIPPKGDDLDGGRKEYNAMLLDKVTDSSNSVVQERYITLSVHKKNVEEARAFFDRTVHDASSRLNHMDSHCEEMDAADRLHILHDFYRVGEESEFRFDLRENMKNGRSFKDAICPDSMEFNHLGYEKSERSDNDDYRNGYKRKQVNSRYGSMEIEVPQDRKSTFEPQVVKKRQKDISDIDQKIISMYAKGMTTRQISETIEDIYGFETSESFISDVTDKILPQIEDWQNRPLDEVYPILYIDAIHYSVRDNGVIRKLAAYVILGINTEGKKEVLTISVGDNESAKYWLSVMNELKNRGVKDVLIICADGLTGIKEAIAAAFPKTEYQRCIVHQVRNTLKYVPDKDRKAFATDLKTIYQATDEKKALAALERVTEKWTPKYPNSMKRWKDNWDAISPIFKFSTTVRTVIYTTNAIESLNSTYRKLNRQRSVFPSDTALLKALYLATFEATKKWTSTIRNWAQVYGELSIMYEGRLPE